MSWATITFELRDYVDIALIRQCARRMAVKLGFDLADQARVAMAVSEVAHLALAYRRGAHIHLTPLFANKRRGMECTVQDSGWFQPAMACVGNSPVHGVALLMDELFLANHDSGPVITMRKWLASNARR